MKITPKFLLLSTFNFLVFSVPLYFRFVNEELFEFNKMILVYAVTIIIAFFWITRMIIEKRLIIKKTPLDIPIGLFVLSQFVSTIFSIHPYTSWLGYYSRFNGGLLSTLCYVLIFYAFVSTVKKKDLGSFFISAFASGLAVAVFGILEHFGHSFSCLLIEGNRSFGVDCWVQDVQSRVFASFGQPNWLAAYVITLFPLAFIAAIQKKLPTLKRSLFIITTLALFIVLLYTRSRSGILGFVVGSGVFAAGAFLIWLKTKKQLLKKIHFPSSVGILTIIVVFALFNGTGLTPSITELIQKNTTQNTTQEQPSSEPQIVVNRLDQGGTDSGEIRKIVWTGAYKVWQRYPIIGSGVETFAYSYYQDRIREHNDVSEWDFLYNKAHNELLNYMATTGTIGVLTYLNIFVFLSIITLKVLLSKKFKETDKLIVLALLSGQAALFVSNFFGFSTVAVNVLMYLYFAITVIIFKNEPEEKTQKKQRKNNHTLSDGSQYIGITLVTLLSLFLLAKVYNYWAADKYYAQAKNMLKAGQYQIGITQMLSALEKSPKEALYYDTLSDYYAKLAVHFATTGEATTAAQLVNETVTTSDMVMQLNNRHLNFYKTRARVLVTLSQIDEVYLDLAKQTLLEGIELSPTDPKLYYTLAVIEHTSGNLETGLEIYEVTAELKPNYERPFLKMSEIYHAQEEYDKAIAELQYILDVISPGNPEVQEKISILEELRDSQK